MTRNEENFPRNHSSQGVLFMTAWSLARLKGKLVHSAENIRFKLIILLSRWRKFHGSRIVSDSFSTLSVKSSLKSSTKLNDVRALYGFGEKSLIPGIETVTQPWTWVKRTFCDIYYFTSAEDNRLEISALYDLALKSRPLFLPVERLGP